MNETPGTRLYQIRLACGDGQRKAEPLDAFAKRVKRVTKADYDPSTISLLERMKQTWRLDDVTTFATVDPNARGAVWLSCFAEVDAAAVPVLGKRIERTTAKDEGGKRRA